MAVEAYQTKESCPDCGKPLKAYRKGQFRMSQEFYCPECGFKAPESLLDYVRVRRRLERIERETHDPATAALAGLVQDYPYAELDKMKEIADKLEGKL